jgi:hypothetical protein
VTYPRQFNTAGSCKADKHYQIDPLARIDPLDVLALIRDERYFVLHAPRQTGKTTSLLALIRYLNANSDYRTVYANIHPTHLAHKRPGWPLHFYHPNRLTRYNAALSFFIRSISQWPIRF